MDEFEEPSAATLARQAPAAARPSSMAPEELPVLRASADESSMMRSAQGSAQVGAPFAAAAPSVIAESSAEKDELVMRESAGSLPKMGVCTYTPRLLAQPSPHSLTHCCSHRTCRV